MLNLKIIINRYQVLLILMVLLSLTVPISASEKLTADLIVKAEYLVTMNDENQIIKNGAVAIKSNLIVAIGKSSEITNSYSAKEIIDGKSRILMPGLINGHTHTAMTLFRGMADDLELMPWLNNYIFPMEAQFVNPEFIKVGSQLSCWEMIRGGTTTFVDMYFYPDVIATETINCGLRGIIGSPSIDFPSPGFKGWDDSFKSAVEFVEKWQGKHELITPAFAPHSPYTVSPEHFKQVAEMARRLNAAITSHLAESKSEIQMIKERYNTTPVSHIESLGLFQQTRFIAAHMVHPTDDEIELLVKNNVGAIHNPTSNLKLAVGISPVVKMLNQGVAVGIGTDGAASNNDLDLWEEIRLAALIHKNNLGDSTVLPAITALKMATRIGAKAIGLEKDIGQLSLGMRADMIQVSYDDIRLMPLYDVVSHLVYMVDSNDVVTTIVSGRVLMKDKKVLTIDENALKKAITEQSQKISKALNERKN